MEKTCSKTVYTVLDDLNIPYKHMSHRQASAMEDLVDVERELGASFCKNLFLCNRQKTSFYLLLIEEKKKFKTANVSKTIGSSRLSFGTPEDLFDMLGVYPGAITPLGLIFDDKHRVKLLVDKELTNLEYICVHPCVNTESLMLKTRDLFDVFFKATGHEPWVIDIVGEE